MTDQATTTTLPVTWVVEHGFQGRWHASSTFETRSDAYDSMLRRQENLGSGQELRVVRIETTIVRTVEGSVARAIRGGHS
ncbi:hypothetical protein M2164_005896 [Streptomyces sp. SAI-208]|uniref:hypothetical protein n=1 Tax=Streptomyces sp. SAI-208 TaxID=2940550 RepID=UPI002473F9B3|nr:hypothetical protein [Streptomyces sp. SAI-208]MDH6610261.1 hypothetical protein [Streptomyces sp. SAI-208]